jgi:hypothetical protein
VENDPLAEPAPCTDPSCGRGKRCPCSKCHGHRWVDVLPSYAVHMHPDPTLEQLAALGEEAQAELWADLGRKRRAAENSVYPCRQCAPALFFRWAGGHFGLHHNAAECDECIELLGKRAARRHDRITTPTTPPRRDTDG